MSTKKKITVVTDRGNKYFIIRECDGHFGAFETNDTDRIGKAGSFEDALGLIKTSVSASIKEIKID